MARVARWGRCCQSVCQCGRFRTGLQRYGKLFPNPGDRTLGVYGIRVVNIRSGGSPDSKVFKEAIDSNPKGMKLVLKGMEANTMLKKLPLMADIANVAVFLASDMAGKITGVTIDVTSGTTAGLNYRMPAATDKSPVLMSGSTKT